MLIVYVGGREIGENVSMTKKDFVALAESLRPIAQEKADDVLFDRILYALCGFCHKQNTNFDEERFRDYLTGEKD